jgi:hypothetical protein
MNIREKVFGQTGLAESPLVRVKNPKGARADELLSIPDVREIGRSADSRLEDRFPLVAEMTRVSRGGEAHAIQLVNVCGGGAMIAAPFEPLLWERLQLHLGDHGTIDCSVIWIRNGRIGVEFAGETRLDCDADVQGALLREVITRHFPEARFEAPKHVEATDSDEHRGNARHPFTWSSILHCEYGSMPARLRNISSQGAMIETSVELAVGAEPYLDLGEAGSVFGKIVWSAGDHSGLRFEKPFDLAQLAHARPQLTKGGDNIVQFGSRKR